MWTLDSWLQAHGSNSCVNMVRWCCLSALISRMRSLTASNFSSFFSSSVSPSIS